MIKDTIMRDFPHTTPNAIPKQVETILEELENVISLGVEGEVVELGCHAGLTSVYIRRLMNAMGSKKEFHCYDSFEGLPDKNVNDEAVGEKADKFQKGYFDMKGTWQFVTRFEQNHLELPFIHQGWFINQEYPEKICFGFLDGDFYQSIIDSLTKVWDKLQPGAVICIHDYNWDQLPGVKKAIEDFFGNLEMVEVPTFGLAVIRKK